MIPLITAKSLEDSRGNKQRFIVGQQKKTRGENIASHMYTKREISEVAICNSSGVCRDGEPPDGLPFPLD